MSHLLKDFTEAMRQQKFPHEALNWCHSFTDKIGSLDQTIEFIKFRISEVLDGNVPSYQEILSALRDINNITKDL